MVNVKPALTSLILDSIFADNSSGNAFGGLGTANGLTWAYRFQTQSTWTSVTVLNGTLGAFQGGSIIGATASTATGRYQICPPDASIPQVAGSLVFHEISNGTNNGVTMQPYPFTLFGDPVLGVAGFANTTFPQGTVASTTNISGGTINTLTNAPAGMATTANQALIISGIAGIPTNPLTTLGTNAPAGWLNAAAFAANSLNGKGDWLLSSGYTVPPTAASNANATAVLVLVNPGNKILTDANNAVTFNNIIPSAPTASQNANAAATAILVNSGNKLLTDANGAVTTVSGGGGGFNGSNSVTLHFVVGTANTPAPNTLFSVVGTGAAATDASGSATIGLNSGVYTIQGSPGNLILWTPQNIPVSGNQSFTIVGQGIVIPPPASGNDVTVFLYTRNANDTLNPGAPVYYRMSAGPAGVGDAFPSPWNNSDSDPTTALWTGSFRKGSSYDYSLDGSHFNTVSIPANPTTSSWALANLLS